LRIAGRPSASVADRWGASAAARSAVAHLTARRPAPRCPPRRS